MYAPSVGYITALGQSFQVATGATFALSGSFSAYTSIVLSGATGFGQGSEISIHTSCSVPLAVGDQFGPFLVVGFTSDAGNTPTDCLAPNPAPTPAPPIPIPELVRPSLF